MGFVIQKRERFATGKIYRRYFERSYGDMSRWCLKLKHARVYKSRSSASRRARELGRWHADGSTFREIRIVEVT